MMLDFKIVVDKVDLKRVIHVVSIERELLTRSKVLLDRCSGLGDASR